MRSQVGFVEVVVAPQIIEKETMSEVIATEGSNVTLVCRATGSPEPTILWKREDRADIPVQTSKGRKEGTVVSLNSSSFLLFSSSSSWSHIRVPYMNSFCSILFTSCSFSLLPSFFSLPPLECPMCVTKLHSSFLLFPILFLLKGMFFVKVNIRTVSGERILDLVRATHTNTWETKKNTRGKRSPISGPDTRSKCAAGRREGREKKITRDGKNTKRKDVSSNRETESEIVQGMRDFLLLFLLQSTRHDCMCTLCSVCVFRTPPLTAWGEQRFPIPMQLTHSRDRKHVVREKGKVESEIQTLCLCSVFCEWREKQKAHERIKLYTCSQMDPPHHLLYNFCSFLSFPSMWCLFGLSCDYEQEKKSEMGKNRNRGEDVKKRSVGRSL